MGTRCSEKPPSGGFSVLCGDCVSDSDKSYDFTVDTVPVPARIAGLLYPLAQVAELVDALGSGPSGGNTVEVRVLSWAPRSLFRDTLIQAHRTQKPHASSWGFLFPRLHFLFDFLSFLIRLSPYRIETESNPYSPIHIAHARKRIRPLA